jgi:hypothetical protein
MNAERAKQEALDAAVAKLKAAEPAQLRLTPLQLVTVMVLEGQAEQLQIAANQLGGWLGLKAEADILVSAREHILRAKTKMQASWLNAVQVVSAADVPRMVQP